MIEHDSDRDTTPSEVLPPKAGIRRQPRPLCKVLVGALLIAAGCVGFWVWWHQANDMGPAVEAAGGQFYSFDSNPIFERVAVRLTTGRLTRNSMVRFLPGRVDDSWLQQHKQRLSRLPSLLLYLRNPQITDQGLAQLNGMDNLVYLDLEGSSVTDGAIEHLSTLSGMTAMNLAGTKITATGFQRLYTPRVRGGVIVDSSQLTGQGVQTVLGVGVPFSFGLHQATDESVALLAKLPLRNIEIQGEAVTSKSVAVLSQMKTAKYLMLVDVSLEPDELAQLKASLPGCRIDQMTSSQHYLMQLRSKPRSVNRLW